MTSPTPSATAAQGTTSQVVVLEPVDNVRLANLCGQFNEHLRHLERRLGVEINQRGNQFRLIGHETAVHTTVRLLQSLYRLTEHTSLAPSDIHLGLREAGHDESPDEQEEGEVVLRFRRAVVRPRGPNQRRYLANIAAHDINFGIGPAGTGKTFLAVACAAAALEHERVRRICLVRPAVEAGERLGFLPGDLAQKVDPYLRPLYDALFELIGFERVQKLLERGIIEVAPLAFMRGRTLNDSFVILDEAQNTTVEQMKMFLTRLGFGTTTVVTGDITQTDLPRRTLSGLRQVIEVLRDTEGLSFTFFNPKDVVRHPLVARILEAYDLHAERASSPAAEAAGGSPGVPADEAARDPAPGEPTVPLSPRSS